MIAVSFFDYTTDRGKNSFFRYTVPILEESLSEKKLTRASRILNSSVQLLKGLQWIAYLTCHHKMLNTLTEISLSILRSLLNNQLMSSLTLRIPLLLSSKLDALRSLCRIQLS